MPKDPPLECIMNRLPDNAKPPAKDRASAAGVFDRPHAQFFAACMATWIWATSVFRLTELGTMQDPSTQALLLACTGFTFLVVITVCNVNEKSASNLEKARKKPSTYLVLTFVGMAGELMGRLALPGADPLAGLAVNCAGTVLSSVAFASETMLLWDCFRHIVFKDSTLFVLGTFVAACLVLFAVMPFKQLPLQVAFPPFACLLVWRTQNGISGRSPTPADEYVFRLTNKNSILHLLLGLSLGLFVVMYGENLFAAGEMALIALAAAAGMVLALGTRTLQQRNPNTAIFEIGVPIVALSWLAWALGLPAQASFLLQLAGLLYIILVDQVLVTIMLSQYSIPPHAVIYIFGNLIVGMAAGLLLGGVDARFLHLFPPIMITALLLASTWLSHDRKLKFGWIVVRIDPMNTSRDFFRYACEKLGQERSLTSREREVLQRLAMGQNRSSISRDLVISEETVKSHTKNIYRKLDVHTRQELIDLVGEKTKKLMDR